MKKQIDKDKNLPQQLSQEQLDILKKETPPVFVKKIQGRGGMIYGYVEVGYVKLVLNQVFGPLGWDFKSEIVKELTNDKFITIKGMLTIKDHEKGFEVTKTEYGGSDIKFFKGTTNPVSLGDDAKSANADALKKCASSFGIAFDVYHPGVWAIIKGVKDKLEKKEEESPEYEELPEIRVDESSLDIPFETKSETKKPKAKVQQKELYTQADYSRGCSKCDAQISERVAIFSLDKFGKYLCMDCQKISKRRNER